MRQTYGLWTSIFNHRQNCVLNFWKNVNSGAAKLSDYDRSDIKEDIVVVAAGPSLDSSVEQLKKWKGKKTIIAVGTVFAKLLRLGIRPDLVTVLDPQRRTIKQLEGMEGESVPLFIETCAYWGFARKYQGPKYLVFSNMPYTTGTFQNYINWINNFIEEHPQTVWYNMSDVGARLEGTVEIAGHFEDY